MSETTSPQTAGVTIIGAGVVGLAVAAEIARANRTVFVLEKNRAFGQEQSSRNSEVIHAGIYYPRDSLKTRLCLEGNRLLYELCDKNGIACRKCGKIIVATDEAEAKELDALFRRARENGVPLSMLSQGEMHRLEPNLKGLAAFYSPTTGIIDSYSLMKYFQAKAAANGAELVCNSPITGIEKIAAGYLVQVGNGDCSFVTRVLINCAGLHSDKIAEIAGIDIRKAGYALHWCKGEYYSVGGGKNRLINRLIYPVPMAISVGVHVCLDVNWRLRLGPLFHYVNKIDYTVGGSRKADFMTSSIVKALPFIEAADLEPESAGIMAMLQAEGEAFRDFIITHEADRGLTGFINLVGIESPGLTSSPAIAGYLNKIVDEILA